MKKVLRICVIIFMIGFALLLNPAFAADKPETFVQLGHQDSVRFASFSADGKYMATASDDRTVKLWDAGSGLEIRTFTGHTAKVTAAAVSSDGRLVVSGDEEGIINIWDASTGRQLKNIVNMGEYKRVIFLAFSPNDKVFSSISIGNATIWNAATGQPLRTVQRTGWIITSFAAGEAFVAARDRDDKPYTSFSLVEMATGREKLSLNYENFSINGASFSRDGRYGLFRSNDYSAKNMKFELLDMPANKKIAEWSAAGNASGYNVALSPDGRYALAAGGNEGVMLWDAFTGKTIRQVTTSFTYFAAFTPDGSSFITLGNYVPTLWDVSSGNIVRSFAGKSLSRNSAAWLSPDGRKAIVAGYPNPPFLIDTETGYIKKVFSGYSAPSFIDNGRLLMVDEGRKKIVLWDAAVGKVTEELKGIAAYYSKDKKYIAEKMSDKDIKIREVASNKEIMSYTENSGTLGGVHISADNKYLVITSDSLVRLIDIETGVESRSFSVEDGEIMWWMGQSVKTSADGRYLIVKYKRKSAMVEGERITIWEIDTGRKIGTIADVGIPWGSSVLSPDGKSMAVILQPYSEKPASEEMAKLTGQKVIRLPAEKMMHLYETATGKIIRTFTGIDKDSELVVFSSDGNYIFSGGESGGISQWDVSTGRKIKSFAGHKSGVQSIEETPGGKRLITCGNDGPVRFWDVAGGQEIAQLVNFADGEWIMITPEGYYNASPNGDRYLNVRVGNNVYGIDNYREAFYRPDLVKAALSGASLKDYRSLADVKQPPKVSIVQTPATSSTEEFKLTLRLEEQGGGIGEVRLFLNGSAVMLDSGRGLKVVAKDEEGVTYRSYMLKLSPGNNNIRAVAFNADNSMQSNEATHQVTAGFTSTRKPAMRALVIGIQDFKNPKLQLKYAVADARLMEDALRKTGSGLFESVAVTLLVTPQETTRDAIKKALEGCRSINSDDLFVFYVASHGVVDDGEYFLITSNVGLTSTEKLRTDALTQTALKELIANIPATKKLIILDTCNAGAAGDAIQTAMLTRGMSEDTAMKILSRAIGSTILSAATSSQEALEGYNGHGLFTWVLSEGLSGKADKGSTGYIETTDIAGYVGEEVPNLAEKVFKRAQYPTISMSGQPFPVGRVR